MPISEIVSVIDLFLTICGLCINIVLVVGIGIAIWQVREAREALKAQSLLKLVDEWRDPDSYRSIRYINRLRRVWKETPIEEWDRLAEKWVQAHVNKDINSTDPEERRLAEEWLMRRKASQLISKMGLLVSKKYLDDEDLFRVDPEIGRQLIVIIPIDIAIQRYFRGVEKPQLSDWDVPAIKWELEYIWPRYLNWYKTKGHKVFSLNYRSIKDLFLE